MQPDAGFAPLTLSKTRLLLENARHLDEIKAIRDKAEAVRAYVASIKLGLDVQNDAAEIKLRAERKAGRLLALLRLRGGDRRSNRRDDRLKLTDMGISQNQSKRWQREAQLPEKDFRQYVREARAKGAEVSSAGLIRLVNSQSPSGADKRKSTGNGSDAGNKPPLSQSQTSLRNEVRCTIEDVRGHCRCLQTILADTDGARLGATQCRVVSRYLTELAKAIDQFERLLGF